jgi:alginate O-acetyltransferase complex protein AlgI
LLFNSYKFVFLFLPIVLTGYWLLQRWHHRAALFWLAVASYVFYVAGEPIYPWLILTSIIFNYVVGMLIGKAKTGRKFWLCLGLSGNLALLGYMKYYNFAREALHESFHLGLPMHNIALPIGISFFTFTQIAFLVDVYRSISADYDPLSYFLFVTFFPHLIAGPILHHKEMMPQFSRRVSTHFAANMGPGLAMFSVGLAKKVMIADILAGEASSTFDSISTGSHLTFITSWVAALAYTGQIYFDFSGYSDMALGIARMFGIDLPVNFNSPYKADSIIDFWRRWHITLSRFLRDYLYIPLGGSRKGEPRRYFNLFATMVLGGIWHGAGWMFLLWGVLHGTFLICNHLFRTITKGRVVIPRLLSGALTFICVVFAWVPFRAAHLNVVRELWRGMAGFNGIDIPASVPGAGHIAALLHLKMVGESFTSRDLFYVVVGLLICWLMPNSQQLFSRFHIGLDSPGYQALPEGSAARWSFTPHLASALSLGVLLGLALRAIGNYSEFIYFHF